MSFFKAISLFFFWIFHSHFFLFSTWIYTVFFSWLCTSISDIKKTCDISNKLHIKYVFQCCLSDGIATQNFSHFIEIKYFSLSMYAFWKVFKIIYIKFLSHVFLSYMLSFFIL
jgi:hypothetical protein